MMSVSQVSAAITKLILLYFTHLEGGNAITALI
jgi:hypothetical protein